MLSGKKLKQFSIKRNVNIEQLASQIVRGGLTKKQAVAAVKNWQKELYKPVPQTEDIKKIAKALGCDPTDISQWKATLKYAPVSPTKAKLVTQLVAGRDAQDALDILKFTHKRAAYFVIGILKSAIANADEQQADVDELYVSEAKVDSAGVRIGTKRWIAKDRGRTHAIRKRASHIHITVSQ